MMLQLRCCAAAAGLSSVFSYDSVVTDFFPVDQAEVSKHPETKPNPMLDLKPSLRQL